MFKARQPKPSLTLSVASRILYVTYKLENESQEGGIYGETQQYTSAVLFHVMLLRYQACYTRDQGGEAFPMPGKP